MAGDNLFALLGMIRADLPEIPDSAWERIRHMLSDAAGGRDVYVPTARKQAHLEALAAADEAASNAELSMKLGVTVRHVKRLKRLRR